ncbi:MAG: hypothetical protein ACSLEX_01850 [Minisyncoccota bacterium]
MHTMPAYLKNPQGFTLIESLVLLFIFAIVSVTFMETYTNGTRLILESKNRFGATALANQKMEIIHSMEYDKIATTAGIPAGDIPALETLSINGIKYQIRTTVQYVDDSFDGTAGQASDPSADKIPNDYKRVNIAVSWGTEGVNQVVTLSTDLVPKGIETGGTGGVLSINVVDSAGVGVEGADVHIQNSVAGIDTQAQSDVFGNVMWPDSPVGMQNYIVTVSKNGYYATQTYPPYPTSPYNPIDEHVSVIASTVNQKTLTMDRYADMEFHTKDFFGTAIPNISFTLKGGKMLGTDVDPDAPDPTIYEFSQNLTTDTSGLYTLENQSYGTYILTFVDPQYVFYKMTPEDVVANSFSAKAGETNTRDIVLLDSQQGSLWVTVQDVVDDNPIANAQVTLSGPSLVDPLVVQTDQYGFAYFPETALPLPADAYTLEVSSSGMTTDTSTVNIDTTLVTKTVKLSV